MYLASVYLESSQEAKGITLSALPPPHPPPLLHIGLSFWNMAHLLPCPDLCTCSPLLLSPLPLFYCGPLLPILQCQLLRTTSPHPHILYYILSLTGYHDGFTFISVIVHYYRLTHTEDRTPRKWELCLSLLAIFPQSPAEPLEHRCPAAIC